MQPAGIGRTVAQQPAPNTARVPDFAAFTYSHRRVHNAIKLELCVFKTLFNI
jgi:hypothetical protein